MFFAETTLAPVKVELCNANIISQEGVFMTFLSPFFFVDVVSAQFVATNRIFDLWVKELFDVWGGERGKKKSTFKTTLLTRETKFILHSRIIEISGANDE